MNPFKLKAADGSERHVGGYKKSPKHAGATLFARESANLAKLPAKVDLRALLTPIEDQGQTNSCTANATAGAYEYLVKRHQKRDPRVSRLFMYYNGRYVADSENIADQGACISYVIDGLKQYGACSEASWDFDPDNVNEEPDEDAYNEAAEFLVEAAEQVPVELEAWKTALAAGHPIIFGLQLYDSFDKHRKPGLVPTPSSDEAKRETHEGHAMLCVGYSDPDQVFIVRNSWGSDWGDKGYCYISYVYLMDPQQNDGDCWIIKRLENLPPDQDSWAEDGESVLEDVSHMLANMSEENYQELLDDMGDHPFEKRLGLLFLAGVGADGEVSDDKIEAVSAYLAPVLEQTGGHRNVKGILKFARHHLEDQDLIDESIELFGEHFPKKVLASIAQQIQEAASAHGLSKEDAAFVEDLTQQWQVEEGADEDDGPDEDEDEDEDEDDDDEDDEDEEDDDDEDEDEEDAEDETTEVVKKKKK